MIEATTWRRILKAVDELGRERREGKPIKALGRRKRAVFMKR